ncbi:hypothetical protein GCM10010178_24810 [Lentzea flava]|uniref:Uncharacterized protein n=1 Tax=Lentzea flava TaxID=103732 RepID=A0ABQ2UHU0_9PSEU|nr:hypothetical protein GCM10010178_24810 [Lentzea flava]
MPSRCDPCPLNKNASSPAFATPVASTSPSSSTARWSNNARVVSNEKAMSAASPGHALIRSTCAASEAADRADTTSGTEPAPVAAVSIPVGAPPGETEVPIPIISGRSDSSGASRITWALVPETPNDETPARRGRDTEGHGVAVVTRETSPALQSMWVEGWSTCSVAGTTPWRIAWTILMTPATPAAAWVWPMLDLMEPRRSGDGRSWP